MKKAQTEMIGIAIIIVLLVLIGLVFLYFALKPEPGFEEMRGSIQVSNLLIAMMKTNLKECENSIKDTIVEYSRNCPGGSICGSKNCDYLKEELDKIIKKSFDKYEFEVSVDYIEKLKIGGCSGGLTSNYIIHEDNRDFKVVLSGC